MCGAAALYACDNQTPLEYEIRTRSNANTDRFNYVVLLRQICVLSITIRVGARRPMHHILRHLKLFIAQSKRVLPIVDIENRNY